MSSIFILKPIIDQLHEDVLHYVAKMKELEAKNALLEREIAQLKGTPKVRPPIHVEKKENIVINDAEFMNEASTFDNIVQEEKKEEKVVVVQEDKNRRDYQRDYQRLYREKKKQTKTTSESK